MKQILLALLVVVAIGCKSDTNKNTNPIVNSVLIKSNPVHKKPDTVNAVRVDRDVTARDFFEWMDSLLMVQNNILSYSLDEHVLVHHNPWIMDSLAHTDYYYLKNMGVFSPDPQDITILHEGNTLYIPDSSQAKAIAKRLSNTYLDVNIPEFKLRIIQDGKIQFEFPVRVGKNSRQFLAMAQRDVDLRTKPGIGSIIRINKSPIFINPRDNHHYKATKRDDGQVTKLPGIPWLEPEIDGNRYGQLIHPTTNLETLGKPVSNGCIGLSEADAWRVYYFAPLGTKVVLRYELEIQIGDSIAQLPNIYPGFENKNYRKEVIEDALRNIDGKPVTVCNCGVSATDKKM